MMHVSAVMALCCLASQAVASPAMRGGFSGMQNFGEKTRFGMAEGFGKEAMEGREGMDMGGKMDFGKGPGMKMDGNMGGMNFGGDMSFGKDGMKMGGNMDYQRDEMRMGGDMEYARKGTGVYHPGLPDMENDTRRSDDERSGPMQGSEENEDERIYVPGSEEEDESEEVEDEDAREERKEKIREWMSENGWDENGRESGKREEMLMAFFDKLKDMEMIKDDDDEKSDMHLIRFKGTLAGEFYASASEVNKMAGQRPDGPHHHHRGGEGMEDEKSGSAKGKGQGLMEKGKKVVSAVKDKVTGAKQKVKNAAKNKKNKKSKKQ